jgi:NAD dependent epimerase/dehydratase
MILSSKTVLVSGAGGFIGSHLVESLVEMGVHVKALLHYNCRNDIGNLSFLDKKYLNEIEIIMGNVEDVDCVNKAVKGCDCIFHLAALIGIPYSYIAPRSYVSANIIGTLNMLEAARHNDVQRVIHTSTSEVYGTALYEPIDEKHPLQGQSPYSASKIGADKLAESYFLSFRLPVVTVRPFNTFGPRQSARAVIPTIISQLLANKETIELGALSPRRDMTYVSDTVRGFIQAATSESTIGKTINLGTGDSISIGDLAQTLVDMVNPKARIISKEERIRPEDSEVMVLISDNTKAKEFMDWAPQVTIEEGLKNTIKSIRKNMSAYCYNKYIV